MAGFLSPFGDDETLFDGDDEFVPEHVPEPGSFLEGHDVLSGERHLEFHETTRKLFEERTVYDMTFGYNLARLNSDTRLPDAGYRYAVEADDRSVLRAEFTPTTPFCPQTHTLTSGSFRAWNGLTERHEYDLVRVRTSPSHHQSDAVNGRLIELESEFEETGSIEGGQETDGTVERLEPDGPDAPF